MIPLRDVIPSRSFPFINIALIVLNSVAFLAELSVSNGGFEPFLRTFALVPAELWRRRKTGGDESLLASR